MATTKVRRIEVAEYLHSLHLTAPQIAAVFEVPYDTVRDVMYGDREFVTQRTAERLLVLRSSGIRPRPPAGKPASRQYSARRKRAIKAGTWRGLTPCEDVAEHLRRTGKSMRRIAAESGISYTRVTEIMSGSGKYVNASTADLLLAVRPGVKQTGPLRHSDQSAVGPIRMSRALAAIGWSVHYQAGVMDVSIGNLYRLVNAETIGDIYCSARVAERIRAVYRRLKDTPRTDIYGQRTAARAAALDWQDPSGWTDSTIDNIQCHWRPVDLDEIVSTLAKWNWSSDRIAAHVRGLGVGAAYPGRQAEPAAA